MPQDQYKWDLFISYARENQDFVRKDLVESLRGYRTADGQPVKAFVDTLSLRAGVNWFVDVTEAIGESRVFVAVYSEDYFKSESCMYELARGVARDPLGARGMFRPVALTASEGSMVPPAYSGFNWANASEEGWFARLIDALGYRHHGRIHGLAFGTEVRQITVGTPLPPVRVEKQYDGMRVEENEDIRVISENGTLRGTTTVKSQQGVALFQDLFFDAPVEITRLVGTANGCTASFSNNFAVLPAPIIEAPREDPRIDATGEVFFFGDPEVIGVAGGGALQIFSLTGKRIGRAAIPRLIRLVRPCAGGLSFCGWDGTIVWVGSDAERREWWPCKDNGICIPGDVTEATDATELLVGLWSGDVWRLQRDGKCARQLRHPGGIQTFDARGDEMYVADLDGNLAVYSGQELVVSLRTEPTIRWLKVLNESVVLIGEEQIYEYSTIRKKIFSVRLPMSERIAAVCGIGEKTVAVSREGRGIQFTRAEASHTFWTTAGCAPVSMDVEARLCVFRNPDQTYTLWHNRRPALQGVKGGLAVSARGTHVAMGEDGGIKISSMESILESVAGGGIAQN